MKKNRSKSLLILLLAFAFSEIVAQSSSGLQIIDLAQIQVRLLNRYKSMDSASRSRIFADSIYRPHRQFWAGYIGQEKRFIKWMTLSALPALEFINQRNSAVMGGKLVSQLDSVRIGMEKLTGFSAKGKWFIVFCQGNTNLGGLSTGEMIIDLSHQDNSSNEEILKWFPHEITHQIMSAVNKANDSTAMNSIIGEGFAVYLNQLYWGKKYTLAQNLGFTEDELNQCKKYNKEIKRYFEKNKFSTDQLVIDSFRSRSKKILPELPGAIGYYIGYEIVRKYAKKNSWKDVFTKSPKRVYELSGY
jgi:hypothetical protein